MKKLIYPKKYLIPKQSKDNGLKKNEWKLNEDIIKVVNKKLHKRVRSKKFRERNS